MVPENIYALPKEDHWEFQGGGGQVFNTKDFKGKYEAKLEFPEGCGCSNQKTLREGSMDIFWTNTSAERFSLKFHSCP